ncbi:radical SAM enzyme [Nitzschia inconspicua]|uniref:Radical SAM enzyme n=1 Tax=Nitzschia inconspicua TaxID=303405 RepID=A0A9K3KB28_9STRA|nr:radical SAM enzyme [Nitzschia inconspicua]
MNSTTYIRRAHHAGSWYSNDKDELDDTLSDFMQTARQDLSLEATNPTKLRGIICPHAGYSYSGPTAAYSYEALRHELSQRQLPKNTTTTTPNTTTTTTTTTTILVLHPSHHFYMEDCAVSGASVLQTPLGDLEVDNELRQEILHLGNFSIMSRSVDEAEHSGEMQYPYLKKVATATSSAIKVLPIMCGNLSLQREAFYGELLSNIIARPNIVCVISTDFCHWGRRFSYQPRPDDDDDKKPMEIHQFISKLDHQGMDHISMQQPGAFAQYLRQTRNTICGRHAVQVWLHAIQHNSQTMGRETLTVEFVKYDQSSSVTSMQESSVSYASAVARTKA